ncbi:MAG TPA: HipA domain-containing protein, partial [Hyphomonadaceae bacterium]|nr:HipA domain-containing protein [Hyphomonadaceae bacterium]
ALFKRMKQFVSATQVEAASRNLFTLFVLNCALRNGDAHLKNFGVTYPAIDGEVRLAPVYDIITTPVYVSNDAMALTLNGRTTWPDATALDALGQVRAALAPREVGRIFEAVADAIADVTPAAQAYFRQGQSTQIGESIVATWQTGVRESLRLPAKS